MEPIPDDLLAQFANTSLVESSAQRSRSNGRVVSFGEQPAPIDERCSEAAKDPLFNPSLPDVNNNNNNNNNNVPFVPTIREVRDAHFDVVQAGMVSYRAIFEAVQKHSKVIFSEQGFSILEGYISSITMLAAPQRPHDAPSAYAFLTAITEVGNTFQNFTSVKERLVEQALELNLSMLVEILTCERLSQEALASIALRHNDKEVQIWVERGVLRELVHLRREIQKDPRNVFDKVRGFYASRPETLHFLDPNTGNSLLHEAFLAYINDKAIGAIEFACLLGLGMKKESLNDAKISVQEMVRNSELSLFIQLIEHEAPTEQILLDLVLKSLCENPEDPLLTTLSEWLTQ